MQERRVTLSNVRQEVSYDFQFEGGELINPLPCRATLHLITRSKILNAMMTV